MNRILLALLLLAVPAEAIAAVVNVTAGSGTPMLVYQDGSSNNFSAIGIAGLTATNQADVNSNHSLLVDANTSSQIHTDLTAAPTLGSASNGVTGKILNALTNSGVAVKASAGQVYNFYCYNPNASVGYFQIYNAASITGTPLLSFGIPATSSAGLTISLVGVQFSTAIEVQAATTATGSTALGSAMDCNIGYN